MHIHSTIFDEVIHGDRIREHIRKYEYEPDLTPIAKSIIREAEKFESLFKFFIGHLVSKKVIDEQLTFLKLIQMVYSDFVNLLPSFVYGLTDDKGVPISIE